MNDLSLAWSMVMSPTAAFAELRERPRFWFPLIALTVTTVLLTGWYFSIVDFEWYKENVLGAQLQSLPEEMRSKALAATSQKRALRNGILGGAFGTLLMLVVQAGYYVLAGKLAKVKDSFRHWFVMMCWSNIPLLFGFVVGAISLAIAGSNAQVDPGAMQPLSLNELVFQRTPSEPSYTFFVSLTLLAFWCWALRIVAVRQWHGKSWAFSSIFVLLPFALFYGALALYAFR